MNTERDQALLELKEACEPDSLPTLTDDELEAILDANVRAKTWEANTFYKAGTVLYPTIRSGRKWIVIRSGTSGPDEPSWPNVNGDGISAISGSVTFESNGFEYPGIYDVNAAIKAAWRKKAAKATKLMRTGGMDMSKIFDNCLKMIEEYDLPLVG